MSSRTSFGLLATALGLLLAGGCSRDLDPLGLAPFPSEALIFGDGFADGVDFQAFLGSKVDAVQIDQVERYQGDASLRVTVPPEGSYAGGAFVANVPRDLSGYNALTFWAKASIPAALNVAGLGNDNTGTSLYTAEAAGLNLSGSWARYVIPIPDPSLLDREAGLFFFAEAAEAGQAYTLWFDEVRFESVSGLGSPRPSIDSKTLALAVGATAKVTGTRVTWALGGNDVTVSAAPSYFTFVSSDETVATVSATGTITLVGEGTATITAALGSVEATGSVVVTDATAPAEPAAPAPTPTQDPANVISLFSNAYTNIGVDSWRTDWSDATLEEIQIQGNDTKKYTNLDFAGIETTSTTVDASSMTHLHMDIWTPNATQFSIKLVDFGADGAYGGGDDTEQQLNFNAASTPALATGQWVSLDIPLDDFTGLASREHLAQYIIVGQPTRTTTVYLDNFFFYN